MCVWERQFLQRSYVHSGMFVVYVCFSERALKKVQNNTDPPRQGHSELRSREGVQVRSLSQAGNSIKFYSSFSVRSSVFVRLWEGT